MTYDEAERLFSTSRSGSKFLGERSTWLEKDGNDFVIRYHARLMWCESIATVCTRWIRVVIAR